MTSDIAGPDWATIWSIVSGLVSIVLAVLAVWLAVHFYNQAKGAERSVAESLAEIKAQTATLERITGRQLDRLTKFATSPREPDPQLAEFTKTFSLIAAAVTTPQLSPAPQGKDLTDDLVRSVFNVFYFSGLANIGWNRLLLPVDERSDDDATAVAIVDETNQFYFSTIAVLDVSREHLRRLNLDAHYERMKQELTPSIRTSYTVEP